MDNIDPRLLSLPSSDEDPILDTIVVATEGMVMVESPLPISSVPEHHHPPQQQHWQPEPLMDYNHPCYHNLRTAPPAYPEGPLLVGMPGPQFNSFSYPGLPQAGMPAGFGPYLLPPYHLGPPPPLMAPVREPYVPASLPGQARWTANRLRELRNRHHENENRRSSKEVSSLRTRNVTPRRPRKRKGGIKPVRPGDELAEPLSKLAANMGSVEVSEMDAFVRRSADLRLKVVKGVLVPARPLNAFMLYRKTYSKHVQPLNGNKDNQRVSRMTGASWLAEDEEVRDRFHGYAHIEQEYHREAFPDYKFSPKPRPRANKQRARIEEDDELDSEYDNLSVPGPPDL